MSNLSALKTRIKSVKSTQKVTKAMKLVAASRLRKAKEAVESSRPYAQKIEKMISNLAANIEDNSSLGLDFPLLTGNGKNKIYLILVISSDRGLCGGLNSSTVKYVKNQFDNLTKDGKVVKILCVGKKAYEQLKSKYSDHIIERIIGMFKSNIEYQSAKDLSTKLINLYNDGQFDVCQVIYSRFYSAISQEQVLKQIIPAPIRVAKSEEVKSTLYSPLKYEPNEKSVLTELLPLNIAVQIYNELLENSASEQGARMAAMDAASNNASAMIKNLTLVYNRTRQANITKELIDIISGANI